MEHTHQRKRHFLDRVKILKVRKAMSGDDRLSCNTSDRHHSQPTVKQLLIPFLSHASIVFWSQPVPAKICAAQSVINYKRDYRVSGNQTSQTSNALTPRLSFTFVCCNRRRSCNDQIKKPNPEQQLVHWTSSQKCVVGINRLWNAFKGVGFARNANKIGSYESDNRKHGGTPMTELTFTEPGHKRRISLGEIQLD